LSLHY